MNRFLAAMVVAGVAGSGVLAASSDGRWIHIRVDDRDEGHGRVDIQVPITMVSGLLPALKTRMPTGSLHVDGKDVDLDELRGYWAAVRNAKDGEYLTVRDDDAHVRVAKSGQSLLLNIDDRSGGGRVRMRIPVPLVDAVLAGGDSVDLGKLATALERAPSGELLSVDDNDSHVRIWIDAAPAPSREDAP